LSRDAFAVFEKGTSQLITSFRRQDVPVAMSIVIDNSGSMRDKRDEVNQAVLNLIRASYPQGEIFVVNFGQKYYLDQDFTSDVNLLPTALHRVPSTWSTALYDAVVASDLRRSVAPVATDEWPNILCRGRNRKRPARTRPGRTGKNYISWRKALAGRHTFPKLSTRWKTNSMLMTSQSE
jgi:VWFA-related protein